MYALRAEVFDAAWYLDHHADLRAAFGADRAAAAQHWLDAGIDEGRQAQPTFWSVHYLQRYPDLSAAFGATSYAAAINHFIEYGIAEGRTGQ